MCVPPRPLQLRPRSSEPRRATKLARCRAPPPQVAGLGRKQVLVSRGQSVRDTQLGPHTPHAHTHWSSLPPLPGSPAHTPPSSHSRLLPAPPPPPGRAHLATLTPGPPSRAHALTPASAHSTTSRHTLGFLHWPGETHQALPRLPAPHPRSRARPSTHTHTRTHTHTLSRGVTPPSTPSPWAPSRGEPPGPHLSLRCLAAPSSRARPGAARPPGIGRETRAQPRRLPRTLLSAPPAPRPHHLPLRERDLARQPVARRAPLRAAPAAAGAGRERGSPRAREPESGAARRGGNALPSRGWSGGGGGGRAPRTDRRTNGPSQGGSERDFAGEEERRDPRLLGASPRCWVLGASAAPGSRPQLPRAREARGAGPGARFAEGKRDATEPSGARKCEERCSHACCSGCPRGTLPLLHPGGWALGRRKDWGWGWRRGGAGSRPGGVGSLGLRSHLRGS